MNEKTGRKHFVFFEFALHFGGSNLSTLLTIKEMQKYCDVTVLDAFGICKEHLALMDEYGIPYRVILPSPKYPIIGGANIFKRSCRILKSSLEMIRLVVSLRKNLLELSPDAVWMNSHRAVRCITLAIGKRFPLVFFARVEGMYPRWYNKKAWRNISLVVGNSSSCLSKIKGSTYEIPNMGVVFNGIKVNEMKELAAKEPDNMPPMRDGINMLFPGSLNERKNQGTAIKGLAEYINNGGEANLWLAGDYEEGVFDEYAKSLPGLAKDLGVEDRVHFLGWRNDVPALIAKSDIVVLTALSEGMPRVLLEAMSLAKPIIATRVSGIPELVRDGIDGILMDVRDSKAFAGALKQFEDIEKRQQVGRAGYERIKNEFTIELTAKRFLSYLDEIC